MLAGFPICTKGLRNQYKIESETATESITKAKIVINRCPNKLTLLSNKSFELSESKAPLQYFRGGGSVHSTLVSFTREILTNVQGNLEEDFEIKKTFGITLVGLT